MKKIFLLIILISINSFSQQLVKKEKTLVQDFLDNNGNLHNELKEKFFLHTNKTTYYSGEKVWFKAYVVKDVDNKPYNTTTNLYVNLLSSTGNQIKSKLFFVEKGKTYGEIKLPDDIKSGKYYIQPNTLWNTNFSDFEQLTQITVRNLKDSIKIIDEKETSKVEESINVQFFPEGGTLLKNTFNTVYFKIKKGNKPIKTKIQIVDNTIREGIGEFYSDSLGLGRLNLYVRENQSKSIRLNYKNKEYNFELPEADEEGFILEKKEKNTDFVTLRLKTNRETLKRVKGEVLYAVLQRNNFVISVLPIELEEKYESYTLKYDREMLFDGINTITLFNSKNEVVSEQKFFYKKEKEIKIGASFIKETPDSLYLGLNLLNYYKKVNTSISVLSSETKMYENKQNIFTDFLVSPYINGFGVKVIDFFNGKYSADEIDKIIKTVQPLKKNKVFNSSDIKPFEQGITLIGKVNAVLDVNENYKVILSSKENSLILTEKVDKEKGFSFKNLHLIHPSKYELSLLDSKGKIIPSTFSVHSKQNHISSGAFIKDKLNNGILLINKENLNNTNINKQVFKSDSEFTELDEVIVMGKSNKNEELESRIENRFVGGDFVKDIKIDKERLTPFNSIKDIVTTLNGITYVNGQVIFHGRGPNTFFGSRKALVIIDGIIITDHTVLKHINASELDGRIRVNKAGAGFGNRGANGVLIIKTKEPKDYLKKVKSEFKKTAEVRHYDTNFGFTTPTKVYEKELISYMNASGEKFYGTIDWIPNLDLNPNSLNVLKIEKTNNDSLKFIINGSSEEGRLVFEVFDIKVPKLK